MANGRRNTPQNFASVPQRRAPPVGMNQGNMSNFPRRGVPSMPQFNPQMLMGLLGNPQVLQAIQGFGGFGGFGGGLLSPFASMSQQMPQMPQQQMPGFGTPQPAPDPRQAFGNQAQLPPSAMPTMPMIDPRRAFGNQATLPAPAMPTLPSADPRFAIGQQAHLPVSAQPIDRQPQRRTGADARRAMFNSFL